MSGYQISEELLGRAIGAVMFSCEHFEGKGYHNTARTLQTLLTDLEELKSIQSREKEIKQCSAENGKDR